MYVCIYIYMYVCIYIYVYMYIGIPEHNALAGTRGLIRGVGALIRAHNPLLEVHGSCPTPRSHPVGKPLLSSTPL